MKRMILSLGWTCLTLAGSVLAATAQTGARPAPPAPPAAVPAPTPPAPAATKPCTAPEFRQFDFWVGDWDLTHRSRVALDRLAPDKDEWEDGKGTNSIRAILDGCVIEEHFEDKAAGFRGQSVSMYNPKLGKWQQTWVDNANGYLVFTGGMDNGRMVLATPVVDNATKRMVFHDIKADSLDWEWEASKDGGKTWVTLWKIHYQRRK